MSAQRQQGFTLIEVVVAFAIFALSVGALYESFAGAVRRNSQAHDHEQGLLVAQSLLSRLRADTGPWKPRESGNLEGDGSWTVIVAPFDAGTSERSGWHAFAVTVRVEHEDPGRPGTVLRSVELARVSP